MAKEESDQLGGKIPKLLSTELDAKLAARGMTRSAFVRESAEKYVAETAPDPTALLLDAMRKELAVIAVFILSAAQKGMTSTAHAVSAAHAAYLSGALAAEVFPPATAVQKGGAL